MESQSSTPNIADLIQSDRVHGSVYTDEAIFQLELEKIWYKTLGSIS